MKSVTWQCLSCKKHVSVEAVKGEVVCPKCQTHAGQIYDTEQFFRTCPLCPCSQFYINKDFNQALGCLILLPGILLVPKTYGLSLPFMALLDWLFYRQLPFVAICYRCGAEFRGFPIPSHIKPFLHHIGEKYDRYRK